MLSPVTRLLRTNKYKLLTLPAGNVIVLCLFVPGVEGSSFEFLYWAALFGTIGAFFYTPWNR